MSRPRALHGVPPVSATLETRAPTAPAADAGTRGQRMPHLAGLDGLRGLAVIGVLLFHGGFTWARGGFLGVSTFFTLSGFLITNLLVREFDLSSTIALGRFWVRRFRRLLPAALVTIGLVGLVWWRIGTPEQLHGLRADMIGAVAYVANWRFYFAGTSYADLFSAPSPLQHFWSLAIEEQFYLFFPPVVWGVMKLGGRRLLTGVLVAALGVSVGLEMWLGGNVDRVYYGTDTRAAELLFGCLLAVWWSGRRPAPAHRAGPGHERTITALADVAGVAALLVVFAAWHQISQTSTRLAHGGFPLYALATTVIIYAATRAGLVSRVLSIGALRWAGLISYGLYLYHWPIFLLIDEDRTGLSTAPLFALRLAVTIPVALASYFLLEQPIRRGTLIRTGRQLLTAGVVGVVVVAAVVMVTLDPPASKTPFANAKIGNVDPSVVTQDPSGDAAAPATATTAHTVMIIGDSGMLSLTPALTAAFQSTGTSTVIQTAGPGFGLSGPFSWREDWTATVAEQDPDLVIVMLGGWDLKYVRENGVGAYTKIVDEAVSILTARGAHILWLPVMPGGKADSSSVDAVYAALPERYPGVVANPFVGGSLQGPDGGYPKYTTASDGTVLVLRGADGWHLCQDGGVQMATAINQAAVDLGWSSPLRPGWEGADWRQLPTFDDPPGGCDPPATTPG
jgi:peptidoglycan/LPS O-acetylase OafA/YrhL